MISLRTRLALWTVGTVALTLAAFGLIVYLTVQQALLDKVDAMLADRAQRTSLYIVVAERPPYFVPENLRKTLANFTSSGLSRQLSQRVPCRGPADEIGQLAATFNGMRSRLDEMQAAQQRFVADASHELRTPLTSILGSAEALARVPDAPPEEREETVADII